MDIFREQFINAFSCLSRFGKKSTRLPKDNSFAFWLLGVAFLMGIIVAVSALILSCNMIGRVIAAFAIPIFCWWLDDFRSFTQYLQWIELKLPLLPSPMKTERGKLFWQFYLFIFCISIRFFLTYLLLNQPRGAFWLIVPYLFIALLFSRYSYWVDFLNFSQDQTYLKFMLVILGLSCFVGIGIGKLLLTFICMLLLCVVFEYCLIIAKNNKFNPMAHFFIINEVMTIILLFIGVLLF